MGGPKLGAKGEMPTVIVIDDITAKVFGGDFKDPETAVAAADSEPADWQNKEIHPWKNWTILYKTLKHQSRKSLASKDSYAHWYGRSPCPNDRLAFNVMQECRKASRSIANPRAWHCSFESKTCIG